MLLMLSLLRRQFNTTEELMVSNTARLAALIEEQEAMLRSLKENRRQQLRERA